MPSPPRGFAASPLAATPELLRQARHLSLTGVAATGTGTGFVGCLTGLVVPVMDATRGNLRGVAGHAKANAAIGAVVSGILRRWASSDGPSAAFRSRAKEAFTGAPVGFRTFEGVVGAMARLDLLRTAAGISYGADGFEPGDATGFDRKAARWWPSPRLLAIAGEHGVNPDTLQVHFRDVPPTAPPKVVDPIVLRPLAITGNPRDRSDRPLSVRDDDTVAASLRADVDAHNAFAAQTSVTGCTPPRFRRAFRGTWALGGRWYAAGSDGVYQSMGETARVTSLRIGGEEVAEIDATASHLSILCALAGQLMDRGVDPYGIAGVPRSVVKAWTTATLGKGSPVTRWSPRATPHARQHDALSIGAALIERFPILADPAAVVPADLAKLATAPRVLPHFLMGLEARALTMAMRELRERHGVLALPMHDGLLVPRSAAAVAEEALARGFVNAVGTAPTFDATTADGRSGRVS